MYLLAPFILQNFKKILRADPKLWGCHFRAQNLSWAIFFWYNHYYFHLPISPFHCAKLKKNSYSKSRVMRMHYFWAQNGPFAPNNFFLEKNINIIFIYLLSTPFIVQNFKKILTADSYTILGPKRPIWLNENFFLKTSW